MHKRVLQQPCRSTGLLAALALALFAGHARAATVITADSFGTTGGGEFLASATGLDDTPLRLTQALADASRASGQFETFCLEIHEPIGIAEVFEVIVSDRAMLGGAGGGGAGDPLDTRTAFLYSRFINGALAGFDYLDDATTLAVNERIASANSLQRAIWFLEGELAALSDAKAQVFVDAANDAAWTDIGGVRVMNLYRQGHAGDESFGVQDLLVAFAPANAVPLPAAALAGAPILGLIMLRRRRLP